MINKMTKRGFTLVELLVVMTIITIIALGSISVAQKVIEQSKESKTEVVLRVLSASMEQYRRDTGDYPAVSGLPGYLQIGYLYEILNSSRKSAELLKNLPAECVSGYNYDWDNDISTPNTTRLTIFDGWYESDEQRDIPVNLNSSVEPDGALEPLIYRNRGDGIVPQIISAGKDRIFFTADDMISTDL